MHSSTSAYSRLPERDGSPEGPRLWSASLRLAVRPVARARPGLPRNPSGPQRGTATTRVPLVVGVIGGVRSPGAVDYPDDRLAGGGPSALVRCRPSRSRHEALQSPGVTGGQRRHAASILWRADQATDRPAPPCCPAGMGQRPRRGRPGATSERERGARPTPGRCVTSVGLTPASTAPSHAALRSASQTRRCPPASAACMARWTQGVGRAQRPDGAVWPVKVAPAIPQSLD